ncbi:MAG: hypothetical protein KGO49_07890 [Gammaproteobacteria bacterium]|nr:hypothetical protein [Gammaproteobacteria bacterium]
MSIDPTITDSHISEQLIKNAQKRDTYIKSRLRQIRTWNMTGWLLWVLLAFLCYWLYQQKPLYLNPHMLANQIQIGKMPTDQIVQLAALGSLMFWGFIALLVGFIFQIYTAMYSERKLIRLIENIHQEDLARHQPPSIEVEHVEQTSKE